MTILPLNDAIFFQKNTSKWHVKLLTLANSLGKTTLFDIDDAPSRINSAVTLRNASKMISGASTVLVGSRNLLEYAKKYQPNTLLFPTSVKLQNYVPTAKTKKDGPVCLGWIGNGEHYAQDLVKILSGPLRIVGSKSRVKFKLVGACGNRILYDCFSDIPGVESELIDQIPWNNPAAVRKQLGDMDIGLYPMLDTMSLISINAGSKPWNTWPCKFRS